MDKRGFTQSLLWAESKKGTNYFIPFLETEVGAKDEFESHFITDFIKENHIVFSEKARAVFEASRKLWAYYHSFSGVDVNASFYDIKLYFQGRDQNGKMNKDSTDEHYTTLISDLR